MLLFLLRNQWLAEIWKHFHFISVTFLPAITNSKVWTQTSNPLKKDSHHYLKPVLKTIYQLSQGSLSRQFSLSHKHWICTQIKEHLADERSTCSIYLRKHKHDILSDIIDIFKINSLFGVITQEVSATLLHYFTFLHLASLLLTFWCQYKTPSPSACV